MLKKLRKELRKLSNPEKAAILRSFFKTGKGEYAEGDEFYGITVPEQRQLSKRYLDLDFGDLAILLASPIHEERFTALLILVQRYLKSNSKQQEMIFDFYFANSAGINNWDLVDLSAPQIVGHYLFDKNKSSLHKLVIHESLWKRRIGIVSTLYFIRNAKFNHTIDLAKKLLMDKEDLIHKATGWMLREVGKRDLSVLDKFLSQYADKMPRTMLRYAIEKYPLKQRRRIMGLRHDPIKLF